MFPAQKQLIEKISNATIYEKKTAKNIALWIKSYVTNTQIPETARIESYKIIDATIISNLINGSVDKNTNIQQPVQIINILLESLKTLSKIVKSENNQQYLLKKISELNILLGNYYLKAQNLNNAETCFNKALEENNKLSRSQLLKYTEPLQLIVTSHKPTQEENKFPEIVIRREDLRLVNEDDYSIFLGEKAIALTGLAYISFLNKKYDEAYKLAMQASYYRKKANTPDVKFAEVCHKLAVQFSMNNNSLKAIYLTNARIACLETLLITVEDNINLTHNDPNVESALKKKHEEYQNSLNNAEKFKEGRYNDNFNTIIGLIEKIDAWKNSDVFSYDKSKKEIYFKNFKSSIGLCTRTAKQYKIDINIKDNVVTFKGLETLNSQKAINIIETCLHKQDNTQQDSLKSETKAESQASIEQLNNNNNTNSPKSLFFAKNDEPAPGLKPSKQKTRKQDPSTEPVENKSTLDSTLENKDQTVSVRSKSGGHPHRIYMQRDSVSQQMEACDQLTLLHLFDNRIINAKFCATYGEGGIKLLKKEIPGTAIIDGVSTEVTFKWEVKTKKNFDSPARILCYELPWKSKTGEIIIVACLFLKDGLHKNPPDKLTAPDNLSTKNLPPLEQTDITPKPICKPH